MRLNQILLLGTVTAYDFEVYLRGGKDKVYTWRDAKNFCQRLHDGWQLVIIDSPSKQIAVERAFTDAGAQDGDAAWIGYTNRDGWGANSASAEDTLDIYGNRARYTNYAPDQPDNKRGNPKDERGEDCVRIKMKNGKGLWEDALCGRRDTEKARKGRKPVKNSFICEPRPDEILGHCVSLPEEEIPEDNQYVVVPAETISFNEAREKCQERGPLWDLVIFESDEELQYVKQKINCLPEAFWIGYREEGGLAKDIFGKPAQIEIPWLVNKLNGDPDEPDSAEEECVRMRHGKMNDAVCTRTWSGAMRDQVGMGYVCEEHLHIAQELYNGQSLEDTCEENVWGIAPFNVQHGCPKPAYCRAKVEVIDAWNKKDPEQKRKSYGFAAKIEVPSWFRATNKYHGYSILLRFPQSVERASFQAWNFNFFNFYHGGREVLMHSKWFTAPNFDNFDPDLNSFTIIVDNLNVKTHPQVLAFNGRQTEHRCFDPSMHARSGQKGHKGSPIRLEAQKKYGRKVTLENVEKISIRDNRLQAVRAKAKKLENLL